jgi:hypothetical protein
MPRGSVGWWHGIDGIDSIAPPDGVLLYRVGNGAGSRRTGENRPMTWGGFAGTVRQGFIRMGLGRY